MTGWASQMDARETLCCHMFLQSKNMFSQSKINPKKKGRTLESSKELSIQTPQVLNPGSKNERLESFPKNALSSMCRRWLLLRWRRKKICNNTTTKKRTQKREKLARASQNSPYSNPLCPFFPSSFHSFICHAGGEIQKRSICIYKTKRKQTMKKRAPTLPPTIIDRGLSMIAMRVTFSRACARARKKKVILYARANARKCARESEEEMKKKCIF